MADIVSAILQFVGCIATPACGYLDYHRKFEQDVNELRRKVKDLNNRKEDIERKVDAEVCTEKVISKQVEDWLKDVQRINDEMQDIEEKVRQVSYFSRGCIGKLVRNKVKVVKEIHRCNFPEGLMIDGPPAIGTTLPTERLEGELVVKEKIWEYLMGTEVGIIGVWGIGGVGKTTIMKHINNELLKEPCRFDKVFWVTVSHSFDVVRLQNSIASKMKKSLPNNEDDLKRASRLMDIMGKVKFVLILDDLWNKFSLEHVGILRPTMENGCKLVITSRKLDVCNYFGCKVVKVQPLTWQESLNLFLDKVGLNILQIPPNLKDVLKPLVKECAGLPLALVVIAGSMRGVDDIHEWRNALNELRECVKGTHEGSEEEIFERLKFSYDRLQDLKMQNCFLSCSLYPEDYIISRIDLIRYWMTIGLIEELGSRQAMYDKGHTILNMLINSCLLEEEGEHSVKMHDVLRDMALRVTNFCSQFMIKAGIQLTEMPDESEWKRDLQKASLMENRISNIPQNLSPKCPILSTLMLQNNWRLSHIPECFFTNMLGLKFLNLSNTSIEALPNSICNLENLTSLELRWCQYLKYVPSLARLKALNQLDFYRAGIEVCPEGIEMLVNLSFLDLDCENLVKLPTTIFSNLCRLQYLAVFRKFNLKIKGEEVGRLKRLETFQGQLYDLQGLKTYVQSKYFSRLGMYSLSVGPDPENFGYLYRYCSKRVNLGECDIRAEDGVVLPNDLQDLSIYRCNNMRSMNDIFSFLQNTTRLIDCRIQECEGIECVVDMVSSSMPSSINNLEYLILDGLSNLRVLVKVEGEITASTLHAPIPHDIFSKLKTFYIRKCSRKKKLFPFEVLQNLRDLSSIKVEACDQMEEIIVSEEDEENHTTKFTLPKLFELRLMLLPKLKRICTRRGVMVCDSLQCIDIYNCPKLERIPLLGIGQPSLPSTLKRIQIAPKEWCESLEWDNPDHKNVLLPFMQYWDGNKWTALQ